MARMSPEKMLSAVGRAPQASWVRASAMNPNTRERIRAHAIRTAMALPRITSFITGPRSESSCGGRGHAQPGVAGVRAERIEAERPGFQGRVERDDLHVPDVPGEPVGDPPHRGQRGAFGLGDDD